MGKLRSVDACTATVRGVLFEGGVVVADEGSSNAPALAAYLRYRLELLGMKPQELADATGISRATVYRLLGDRAPETVSSEHLRRLAEVLQVDPRDLAMLWHGLAQEVDYKVDERDELARGFILATKHLSVEELRAALEVARHAAGLARRGDEPTKASNGNGD